MALHNKGLRDDNPAAAQPRKVVLAVEGFLKRTLHRCDRVFGQPTQARMLLASIVSCTAHTYTAQQILVFTKQAHAMLGWVVTLLPARFITPIASFNYTGITRSS